MKTALLVVSFGTTHLDTIEKTIVPTEEALRQAFPDYPFYRAFTSKIVRSILDKRYGWKLDDVPTALQRIQQDGFQRVLIQPTLIIPGEENRRMLQDIQTSAGSLQVALGKALMCDESDMEQMIPILLQAYATEPDCGVMMMGHGTDHSANELYEILNRKMSRVSQRVIRVCTVEGTPTFDDAVEMLKAHWMKKVTLAPLLFVAGDHAKHDMAGSEPDSLKSLLEAAGMEVRPVIQGLGELEQIRALYVNRARKALEQF